MIVLLCRPEDGQSVESRMLRIQTQEVMDNKYGFERHKESTERLGWLINMHPVGLNIIQRKNSAFRVYTSSLGKLVSSLISINKGFNKAKIIGQHSSFALL